ncbi:hypothetical protein CROQUDRAFT_92040 [Cronartium quercuum f. sp. fusiforme G11]|uniref:Peroxisomal ATPase PEX1 N-terminal C-lobe domain-containing protein n=1 Tax=Cronartium quercuum f. sp. fusiforme G11 TaxID=708437 RepID=A0A9P6NMR8_9BASI|nr:hypothetical protein CROQUDRAFT_92040 [Cronartium quercuum f. sp. fusiforme G11]
MYMSVYTSPSRLGSLLYVTIKATTVANVANSTCLTPSIEDHFLTQIRILAQPQMLLVWLYGKMVIRVKMSSVHASHSSPNSTPHTPYLLINETEVIVSSRPRVDGNSDAKQSHQILSGDQAGEKSTEAHDAEFNHSSPIVNSKPAQPTKPVDQATQLIIAPRVQVVPAALIPIGYVSMPIQLQTRWFGSHHSAAACGHPGDYEG